MNILKMAWDEEATFQVPAEAVYLLCLFLEWCLLRVIHFIFLTKFKN